MRTKELYNHISKTKMLNKKPLTSKQIEKSKLIDRILQQKQNQQNVRNVAEAKEF